MKRLHLLLLPYLFACLSLCVACGDKPNGGSGGNTTTDDKYGAGEQIIKPLLAYHCTAPTEAGQSAMEQMQTHFKAYPNTAYNNYMKMVASSAEGEEYFSPVLNYYRKAFDKAFDEITSTTVSEGEVAIWILYNMGTVVKTPSHCFAIDIKHRYGARLIPYIDFMCITHNHSDHYQTDMIEAMVAAAKPVVSNFLGNSYPTLQSYTSTTPTVYDNIASTGIDITTNINDHNGTLKNFVETFQIDCGADTRHTIVMHVGDTSFDPAQYSVKTQPDIFITRYSPNNTEESVLGSVVKPQLCLTTHYNELGHTVADRINWPDGTVRLEKLKTLCPMAYMPLWGEKVIWNNSTDTIK